MNKPAVYFLIGKDSEDALLPTAYIGEAENLWNRLSTHDSSKNFWQTAIVFVSKDNNLTKAYVRYLENRCLTIATQAKRFNLENGTESSLPSFSEADIAEMEEFLENLKLLLSALGYPILQEVISKEQKNVSDPLFNCKGKGALATGRMTNDGFVVYKDSTITADISKAVIDRNQKIIEKLLANNYLEKRSDGLYTFVKDYVFNSPSAASGIVLGNLNSDWKKWKTESGKTLGEVYKK
jgi:hypothetical protein